MDKCGNCTNWDKDGYCVLTGEFETQNSYCDEFDQYQEFENLFDLQE